VEVEICRADELEVCRGLASELDEMWSYVAFPVNRRNFVRWCDLFQETGSTPGAALFSDYQKGRHPASEPASGIIEVFFSDGG
jgi:hypothetical protein